jgi:tight adherence protein B
MSSSPLLIAAETLALLALLLVALQGLWVHYRARHRLHDTVRRRLATPVEMNGEAAARVMVGPLERILLRAGIQFSRHQVFLAGLAIAVLVLLVLVSKGAMAALLCAGLVVFLLWWYWRLRFQQQRRQIYEQLPGLIDTALRYIDAGRSLENALVEAFHEAPPVFDPLSFRLRSAVESGRDYTGLFEDFAALYKVPPLVLVSIALRTAARFGSSVRPVLRQVADSLRSQQELRREFLAATAETRFTAAVFALLPIGLAAYMIFMNEGFSQVLLHTDTGHTMLGVAGGLQALGMIVIWRMIQGVGRE